MSDIYQETDLLIEELNKAKYENYANAIKEAKLSGSVASEIIGLILEELNKSNEEINSKDTELLKRVEKVKQEIKNVLKLD